MCACGAASEIFLNENKLNFSLCTYILCQTNGLNQTYDTAICALKCNNIANFSKGAIMNRRDVIKPKYFRQLNDALIDHIMKNQKCDAKIKIVDGSHIHLPKRFTKYGFHLSNNRKCCAALRPVKFC